MPFVPGAYPEYDAFYNGLSGFDKETFKRFCRSNHTQTNQKEMSMFNLNCGCSRHMGIYTVSKPDATDRSNGLSRWLLLIGCDKKLPGLPGTG